MSSEPSHDRPDRRCGITREKLTPKQAAFVEQYLVDLNATQAAIRAGYSRRSARAIGQENLTKPDVQAAITAAQQARSERVSVTADRVLEELAALAFTNLRDVATWGAEGGLDLRASDDLAPAEAAALREVKLTRTTYRNKDGGETERETREVKMHDKLQAVVQIGKHLGMWPSKVEHSGPNGGAIELTAQVSALPDEDLRALVDLARREGTL